MKKVARALEDALVISLRRAFNFAGSVSSNEQGDMEILLFSCESCTLVSVEATHGSNVSSDREYLEANFASSGSIDS